MIFYLIGFAGVGKTTLGEALVQLPVAPGTPAPRFIDLDWYIEERQGMSVAQIFATGGEATFRRLEADALATLAAEHANASGHVIIACGGGTPCFGDNAARMRATGTVVMLTTDPQTLFCRLRLAQAQRPLIASKTDHQLRQYIADTMALRNPAYQAAAHATFDTSHLETADEIRHTATLFAQKFMR